MKECLRDESTLTSIKCCLMFYADLLVYIYMHTTRIFMIEMMLQLSIKKTPGFS